MRSSQSKNRSIAAQLILLFTLAATLLLTCALGMCYWLVVRHAFEEDNAALSDKIAVLSQDVKQSGPEKALAVQSAFGSAGEHSTYWIRILDPAEHLIAETANMASVLPQQAFPPPANSSGRFPVPKNYRSGPRIFSLITTSEQSNGAAYIIQIAQDRSVDAAFEREFGILFLVVLALSVLGGVVIVRITTRHALQPVAEMARSVQRIGPTHLSERIAPRAWPRELQPLAEAFDQMLGRLEDTFTRLSQFSADLAHELRTPVGNILGEAQVSLTRDRTPAEYREVIESIVAECEDLSRIVDNLLFLARAESARERVVYSEFDGRTAIEKIAAYYSAIAEDRNVRIDFDGDAIITADPVLFERAVSNVVENALNFTPDGGTIAILLSSDTDHIKVAISDTGCGIAPEHIARVFDRFYQADPSRSSRGSGLGLALVKSIVELHNGSVAIQSQMNQGTKVTLRFPRLERPSPSSSAHPSFVSGAA
jgi:two-component system heavy metal sensor histidine kinase CusS